MLTRAFAALTFSFALMTSLPIAADNTNTAITTPVPCNATTALQTYLKLKSVPPMRIAAFDHVKKTWSGWTWDGSHLQTLAAPTFAVPPENDPTLVVDRGGRVGIFVVNTSPLLYAAEQGAVTVSDIAAIEDLKKILSLMGGFVSSATQVAAQNVTSGQLQARIAAANRTMGRSADRSEMAQRTTDLPELADAVASAVIVLDQEKKQASDLTKDLVDAAKNLSAITTRVDTARDVIAVQLQLLENEPPRFSRVALENVTVTSADLLDAFQAVEQKIAAVSQTTPPCPETITALRQALLWKIDGVPPAQSMSQPFASNWPKLVSRLTDATADCAGALGASIHLVGRWLATNPPQDEPADPATAELFMPLLRSADDYVAITTKRDGAVSNAEEALSKRSAALKETVQVSNFVTLRNTYLAGVPAANADCLLAMGVVPVRELTYDELGIGPTKVRNEEFALTIRPAFAAAVERQRADAAGKFHLRKSNLDFDIDTALAYTRLYESEFKAVKVNETDTKFTIQETGRKTRAGQLAMLVTGRPQSLRGLGLQLGFGLDTANPALYTGVAWRLGDFAKISVGETFQRVKKLANGQAVGQSDLTSAEALTTRDGWTSRPYIALSLTLDNLPLFSGK